MKQHARTVILVLALLGLGASVSSLYVHYRSLQDPAYTSFCDVSETVSCQALYESQYGSVFGVPVAAGGAIWSALVLLLAWRGMAGGSKESGEVAGYIFFLSTIGLAMVLYLGYASFFVIGKVCPLCMAMYVSVIGIFVAAGAAASVSLSMLPGRLARDLQGVIRSPLAATLGVLWLIGSVSLVAFFPRESAPAQAGVADVAVPPTETLSGAALQQFEEWIAAQPRVAVPLSPNGADVLVVKFNDYQCPSCRQAYLEYRGIIARYESQFGSRVRFVTMDFPLEGECNVGAVHPAACEASAAVRMAKAVNKGTQMEEWLFSHQDTMTPQSVKDGLKEIAQVSDFDAQYAGVLEQVKADAKLGRELGVSGTPAFFVNGIRIQGGLRPVYFDALIAYELAHPRKAAS
ncbi:MAG: vitamin K epoxide reductase family protein [Vicinamibacterales bacterium]